MAYLNKVFLMGNLGKDPEIRTFQSGSKCATFSLATSKRYRDQNGEQKEQTQWHTVKVLGRSADTLQQLGVKKGTQMLVEGELTYSTWTDQTTGQKRYSTEVVAFTFQLIGPVSCRASTCRSPLRMTTRREPPGSRRPPTK